MESRKRVGSGLRARSRGTDKASAFIHLLNEIKRHPLANLTNPMTDTEVKEEIRRLDLRTARDVQAKASWNWKNRSSATTHNMTRLYQAGGGLTLLEGPEFAAWKHSQEAARIGVEETANKRKLVDELRRQ